MFHMLCHHTSTNGYGDARRGFCTRYSGPDLQHHIADWCHGDENFLIISKKPDNPQPIIDIPQSSDPNAASSSETVTLARPVPKNGHILKLMAEGGVFCQLCGKSTKLLKHQRLKILSRPCKNPNLPPLSSAPQLEQDY